MSHYDLHPSILTAEEVDRHRFGGSDEVHVVGLVQGNDRSDLRRLLEWEFRTDQGWAQVNKVEQVQPGTWQYDLTYREYA